MVDPFEALVNIAKYFERIQESIENAKAYKNELISYKPYLRSIKSLENNIRSGKMNPVCPKCHKGFDISEITSYTRKEFCK